MQTTLLGIAIAIILALLAALVGPHFVDWDQYRGEFEARASSLTGLKVHIAGPIEARLLPTPALTLQKIEVARPGDAGALRARSLGIEFALGALARGEWRATHLRVEGAEFAFGLDSSGRLDWPAPSVRFDPDSISIERLDIVDSRAILADAANGSHLILEQLEFRGELRSLVGPVKGEGSFVVSGQHYPYRVSAGRAADGGAVRVRLNVDPIDRPLIADADGLFSVEHGIPRFEGTLQLARPVGRTPDGITEPWRITSHVRGDSLAAIFEQIEFQYGPDERAIKLRGDANLTFGRWPQLVVGLASPQVDLDRVLALPEPTRRRPLVAVKSFADYVTGAQPLPIPVKLGISVENVTLAGATLQRVSGELRSDPDAWDVEVLDFRAPGSTQVRLSGRLSLTTKGIAFSGPAKVEARDPRALVAWLTDRADTQAMTPAALRAEGEVKLGSETIAIDRLKAELDRMTIEGHLAYSWASGERPPRVEAVLSAPEIDFDRVYALTQGMFADTAFEWPREGKLSVKVGRASFAGVDAKRADVNMQFDRQGLDIERFAIGDFGGAALAVKGRIDTRTPSPRGSVSVDLDARALDGVTTLMEKFAPQTAEQLRRRAGRFVPAKVSASLTVSADAARAAGAPPTAAFKLDGRAGTFHISLKGNAEGADETFTFADLPRLAAAKFKFSAGIDAGEGGALVELLGLDQLIAVDKRPGQMSLVASGAFNSDMAVDARLAAGGLDVAAQGTVRVVDKEGPVAALDVKVASANLRTLRPPAAKQPVETLPTALTARLALAEGAIALTDLSGKLAGTEISGRLKIGLDEGPSVDGEVELGLVNLPAIIAAVIGTPPQGASGAAAWPAEPFEAGLLGRLNGQIAFKSARVPFTPRLAARDLRAVVRFDQSELALTEIGGTLAGGRVAGKLIFQRGADGLRAESHLQFAGTEIAELLPGEGRPPLSGRLTFNVDVEGSGRSPVALIGSLRGGGTFTLQDGRAARLDPAAFDAVIRSIDQGLPIDATRIRDRIEVVLGNGGLPIPVAEGEIAVMAGQARLNNTIVRAQGADLALGASVDLAESALDARLTLSGPLGAGGPADTRPEIGITLKGPIDRPKRTLEVAALASWLALRAVEQQAKRLDALESGHEPPTTSSAPGGPTSNASAPAPAVAPAVAAPSPRTVRTHSESPAAPARPRRVQPSGPTAGQFVPLPLDLRPPPRQAQP